MMPVRAIRRRRIDAVSIDHRLGTRDEEGPGGATHKGGQSRRSHDPRRRCSPASGEDHIEGMNVGSLPSEMWFIKLGMLPRRSSSVCIFTAALVVRKCAHGKFRQAQSDGRRVRPRHSVRRVALVQVEPSSSSSTYSLVLAWVMSRWADAAWIRQSRLSLVIGQRRAPDRLAEAHVIEFRCVDREAGLDVAQAFPNRLADIEGVRRVVESHSSGLRPDVVIDIRAHLGALIRVHVLHGLRKSSSRRARPRGARDLPRPVHEQPRPAAPKLRTDADSC